MRSLGRRWQHLLFAHEQVRSLGLMRIGLGFVVLFHIFSLSQHWNLLFGEGSLVTYLPAKEDPYSAAFYYRRDLITLAVSYGLSPALWWLGLVAGFGLTLGAGTRLATIYLFLLYVSMSWRNPLAINGEVMVLKFALFYGIFLPLAQAPSLDSENVKSGFGRLLSGPLKLSERWPLHLLRLSICLVYGVSTFWKLTSGPDWLNGEALYWATHDDAWTRFHDIKIFDYRFLSAAGTYGSLLVEGLFPSMVCFAPTRRMWIPLTIALQLAIVAQVEGVAFFSLSIAALDLCFLNNQDLRWYGALAKKLQPFGKLGDTEYRR